MGREINDWDKHFLEMARLVAERSKDPSTKVGAVIVDEHKRIVSTGYNGLPRGVDDSAERLENRETKYQIILHAEHNAVLFARRDLSGCTVYTSGFSPCAHCASILIQVGIKRVVSPRATGEVAARWAKSLCLTNNLFREAGVQLDLVDA
jgi:dCMP deaminase